jgi:hypothetical protein
MAPLTALETGVGTLAVSGAPLAVCSKSGAANPATAPTVKIPAAAHAALRV